MAKKKSKRSIALVTSLVMLLSLVVGFDCYQLNQNQVANIPDHIDYGDEIQIADNAVPLASVKTKVKKSTKTKSKKVKLEEKSLTTYSVKHDPEVTVTFSTSEKKGKTTDVTKEVTVVVTEKYKKNSNKMTLVTKTTTKTTTTTYPTPVKALDPGDSEDVITDTPAEEPAQTETAAAEPQEPEVAAPAEEPEVAPAAEPEPETAPAPAPEANSSLLRQLGGAADENVLKAYEDLGFTVILDPSVSYQGRFNGSNRTITLKNTSSENIYHELGHFVAFIAGNVDISSSFKAIYNDEKSKYTGRNPSYVLTDSSEYFAESYREYILYPDKLMSERPETYDAVKAAVGKITDSQVKMLKMVFASVWK